MTFPSFRLLRRPCAVATDVLGRNGKEIFRSPLPHCGRLASLNAEFLPNAAIRAFEANDIRGLLDYAPESLALPLNDALSLADQKLRGLVELPSLKYAIVVLTSVEPPDSTIFAPHHRDLLWKAFGLPVFEQLRGWDSRVIARECEVHDGLHFSATTLEGLSDGDALATMGITASLHPEIVREHCECGIEAPRLRFLPEARTRAAVA